MNRRFLAALIGAGLLGILQAQESPYRLNCTLEPADGLLKCNETVKVTTTLLKNGKPAIGETLRITTKWETVEKKIENIVFKGEPIVTTFTSDKPGWVYFGYQVLDANGKPIEKPGKQVRQRIKHNLLFEVGAMFDPDKIRAKPNYPEDFELFWKTELAKLRSLKMEAKLNKLPLPNQRFEGKIEFYGVELNCLGRAPVTGYFAIPVNAKAKSLPIVVDYQSLTWTDASKMVPCNTAMNANALAFCMSWHGLELGHPASWYEEQKRIIYKEGGRDDCEDPVKWFYHDMFYRVIRTLDYLKARPEWNGKDVIVRGGSLGGIETIAAAALDPQVTVAIVSVPTGCELNALESGRIPTWVFRHPSTYARLRKPEVMKTMSYHEGINFARFIRCELYLCTGFADELCFPSNVYAFYNALPLQENVKKFMSTNPYTGHYGTTSNTKGDGRIAKGLNSVLVSELHETK